MTNGKRAVVVVSLITALCLLGDAMLYVVLPLYWQEVGLSSWWEVGIVLSMNRIVRLPLNGFAGWVYQKVSVRTALGAAVCLGIFTTMGYAWADTFFLWVLMRAIWGVSWTFLRLGGYYIVIESSDMTNRGQLMGLYNGLYRLGNLVGTLIGGILADLLGFRMMAWIFGLLTVGALVPWAMVKQQVSARLTKSGAVTLPRSVWRTSSFFWLMLTGLIVTMIYQGMLATILSPLTALHTETITLGGAVLGAAALGGLLQAVRWSWEPWGAPWVGKLSDRFGGRGKMLAWSCMAAAILFALVTVETAMAVWIVIVLGVQMGGTFLTTLADAAAADRAAEEGRIAVMTWFSFAIDLGAALGPILALALVSLSGIHSACIACAVLFAVLAVYWHRRTI